MSELLNRAMPGDDDELGLRLVATWDDPGSDDMELWETLLAAGQLHWMSWWP